MNSRNPLLLALCASAAPACFIQKLDTGASQGGGGVMETPDGGSGAPFPVNLTTPPIGLAANNSGDVTETVPTACDKVKSDAHDIRQRVCSPCHEGAAVQGAPLTFILDDDQLVGALSTSMSYAGRRYVVPGNPDSSLIYQRAAIVQDMPPGGTDVRNVTSGLSVSDFSVLRDWILSCLGTNGGGAGGAPDAGRD